MDLDLALNCMKLFLRIVLYIVQSTKMEICNLVYFGTDPATNETAHFADITLEQNSKVLNSDEIVVDCKFKPTLVPQLLKLGVIKNQTGIYVKNSDIYPVYSINSTKVQENYYPLEELVAA